MSRTDWRSVSQDEALHGTLGRHSTCILQVPTKNGVSAISVPGRPPPSLSMPELPAVCKLPSEPSRSSGELMWASTALHALPASWKPLDGEIRFCQLAKVCLKPHLTAAVKQLRAVQKGCLNSHQAFPLTSCVILTKLLNLSVLRFLHL